MLFCVFLIKISSTVLVTKLDVCFLFCQNGISNHMVSYIKSLWTGSVAQCLSCFSHCQRLIYMQVWVLAIPFLSQLFDNGLTAKQKMLQELGSVTPLGKTRTHLECEPQDGYLYNNSDFSNKGRKQTKIMCF